VLRADVTDSHAQSRAHFSPGSYIDSHPDDYDQRKGSSYELNQDPTDFGPIQKNIIRPFQRYSADVRSDDRVRDGEPNNQTKRREVRDGNRYFSA
jgi:hypothetical protein